MNDLWLRVLTFSYFSAEVRSKINWKYPQIKKCRSYKILFLNAWTLLFHDILMKVFCYRFVICENAKARIWIFECSFRIYFNTVPNLYHYLSLSIIYLFCIFRVSSFLFKCLVSLKRTLDLEDAPFEFDQGAFTKLLS